MARKKKVELDGAEYTITPLSFKQVENWAQQRKDLGLDDPNFDISTADPLKLRTVAFECVICPSLNNAKEINGEWTAERVADEMDKVLYEFLFAQILEFMGFVTPAQGTTSSEEIRGASGESSAAS